MICSESNAQAKRNIKIAIDKGREAMDGQKRSNIRPGLKVDVVLKKDQRTGKRTRGIVKDILTNSSYHPHGIKVRLESGEVGRVQEIIHS
jgi:uncharacterized repeat protein (TIGR03833 family)